MSLKANIFNISKCSLNDGPGVRTAVYFKGCNLHCAWCHNPESHYGLNEIAYADVKCIRCGACMEICPENHIVNEHDHVILRNHCIACGRCVTVCNTKALTLIGKEYSPDEVLGEVLRDKAYYDRTGGGITLSGGECLLYPEFSAEVLRLSKESGIHTLIESAFCVDEKNIRAVLHYTDMFYVDLKIFDSDKHKIYTGRGNELIKENIRKFAKLHGNLIVRTPLIPGINDDLENLISTAEFAVQNHARGMQLLKYNPLGVSKYKTIGKVSKLEGKEAQTDEVLQELCIKLNAHIGKKGFVI